MNHSVLKSASVYSAKLPDINAMREHLAELVFTPLTENQLSCAGFENNQVTGELAQFIPALFAALGGEESCDSQSVSKSLPETGFKGEEDPMYQPVVEFVLGSGRASVSAIQRQFKIGYNRAARLTEAMEAKGVISKLDSQGLRKVIAKEAS
ncbi:DNA translocase FtsK [Aeromonas salmonicida]|uniref:DNA translocase FtsK n=1 Tax=Aeromonas salmonicida TaxID=645 RepID=UPI00259F917F|nr:DNA translocase FtsK [Aeromonas salmonicida]MDM5100369.1 hypothetical protein [Aeromonas salmonicida]